MVWVPRIQLWKEKKEIYVLAQNQAEKVMCSYEALERMKQNLLSAISLFFFLQPKLEIWCYYTRLFQIFSGLVPRRGNTLSGKSSHQKPLDAVQIRGVFWGWAHANAHRHKNSLPPWLTGTLLITAGGNGHHWENSLLCRTSICTKPANNYTAVSIFLYWTLCAHSSPWRFTLIYRTESSYYKKKKERKSTHLLTLILFLLISEQMVTYHNGSFIKISIF